MSGAKNGPFQDIFSWTITLDYDIHRIVISVPDNIV